MTTNRSRSLLILFGQILLVGTLVATFSALALWQWDRAASHQELERELDRIAAMDPVPLVSIHKPQVALDGEITNRMVTLSGRYIDFFTASGQDEGSYHVALMEVRGSVPRAAILVAREILDSDEREIAPFSGEVELVARLLPAQREDRDPGAREGGNERSLVRIDSALLVERVADPTIALYDGYLLVQRELRDGVELEIDIIPDLIAEPTIPGYYWQHISYVVIWFLMAGLTLYLPFYQWRRNRMLRSDLSES